MSTGDSLDACLRRLSQADLRALLRASWSSPAVRRHAHAELARRFTEWTASLEGTRAERLAQVDGRPGAWTVRGDDLLPVPVPRIVSCVVRLRILEESSGQPLRPPMQLAYREPINPLLRRRPGVLVGHSLSLTLEGASMLWRALRSSVQ